MPTLYATLMTLIPILISPLLLLAAALNRWGMRQRLGILPELDGTPDRPVVWFHAASVGEVVGMAAVVPAFREAYPGYRIVISTMTSAGLAHARQAIPGVEGAFLLPLDVPFIMRRFIAHLNPVALVLLEGELWPSLLQAVRNFGCPIILANARMSDRSYPRNKWIRPLMRHMLTGISHIGAQTLFDAERFILFGADPERVTVTGNVKFDQAASIVPTPRSELRASLGLSDDAPVIIAGCPRPVEEEQAVLHACTAVYNAHPDVRIIWAPRHLDRLGDVTRMLNEAKLSWIRRSIIDRSFGVTSTVILLDTMGELARLYGAADIAFVGATLVPLGGHNLLEPAACGIPVIFGPNTQNVRASAEALLQYEGGIEVRNADELAEAFIDLLDRPEKRRQMGQAAAGAVQSGRGALEQTMAIIAGCGL